MTTATATNQAACCVCGGPADPPGAGLDYLIDAGLRHIPTVSICDACNEASLQDAYELEREEQAAALLENADIPATVPVVPLIPEMQRWLDSDRPGAFFWGKTGVGKTVQCCALLREWIQRTGTAALYRLEGDVFDRLSDFDNGDPRGEFRRLRDVGLLILDDLGTSKPSDFRADALFRLIDARYQDQTRRTVFVTNLEPEAFKALELIDDRVYRRIGDLCGRYQQIRGSK